MRAGTMVIRSEAVLQTGRDDPDNAPFVIYAE
jgi:hypothetical protein